jgi:holo-[acyl-carrier protein] synthase
LIFGTGIDIIEVERIENQISKSTGFKEKIFTVQEIEYCESKKYKAQNYAVRFAAKEAFLKAIGIGWRGALAFNEIEILNNRLGKPEVFLYGNTKKFIEKKKITGVHVSLSHIKSYASAVVIIEK